MKNNIMVRISKYTSSPCALSAFGGGDFSLFFVSPNEAA